MQEPEPDPLDRRKGESSEAHEAFAVYAKLGSARDHAAVAVQLSKSASLIRRWAARWEWAERARQADNDRQRIIEEACDKVLSKRAAVWEERRAQDSEERFVLARRMAARVIKMLDYPLVTRKVKKTDKDGRPLVVEVRAARWSLATAATLARVSCEITNSAFSEMLDREDSDFDPEHASEGEIRDFLERAAARRRARREGA
jgi:hypothetical protein